MEIKIKQKWRMQDMKYNFDEVIDRRGTMATKVEQLPKGSEKDALP